jgi:hypothetical protein
MDGQLGAATADPKRKAMTRDPDKRLDEMLAKLRKLKGLGPMTPEEADAAFDAAPADPVSKDQIRSIVDSVTSGELAIWQPAPDLEWTEKIDVDAVKEDAMQLYRNKGDDDEETEATEDELRDELLSDDDESENQDGLDGGAAPPRTGG